jgi:hypothetical protein
MTEDQLKAINELIRVTQVSSYTLRGLWFYSREGSSYEATLRDIETRLDQASSAVQQALTENTVKPDTEVLH